MNMLLVKPGVISVLLSILTLSESARRIKDGVIVEDDKQFVVYLTRATLAVRHYDYWLCGGAIVSEWYIITSAACVEDVKHLYAVAGYRKYVQYAQIHKDLCTQQMKKRITFICVPKLHEFEYKRVEKWAQDDIAVVRVETRYYFNQDSIYLTLCHYGPRPIQVNYDPKRQEAGLDAIVYGWGHADKWRNPKDPKDYNQDLHYAAVSLHNKDECKQYFRGYKPLYNVIDQYMICSIEGGNVNPSGEQLVSNIPRIQGCSPAKGDLKSGILCGEDETVLVDDYRKSMLSRILHRQQNITRRQGICQNDHGGPLVTWSGTHEILIGVASVFRVSTEATCTGPYLYTSTQCNSAFLDCILNMTPSSESSNQTRRNEICDKPPRERGFDFLETHVSWKDHPDGPAYGELPEPEPEKLKPEPVIESAYNEKPVTEAAIDDLGEEETTVDFDTYVQNMPTTNDPTTLYNDYDYWKK